MKYFKHFKFETANQDDVTFSLAQYSTLPTRAIVNTCPLPVCSPLRVVHYMVNYVLHNPAPYRNGYPVCAHPSCVLVKKGGAYQNTTMASNRNLN